MNNEIYITCDSVFFISWMLSLLHLNRFTLKQHLIEYHIAAEWVEMSVAYIRLVDNRQT